MGVISLSSRTQYERNWSNFGKSPTLLIYLSITYGRDFRRDHPHVQFKTNPNRCINTATIDDKILIAIYFQLKGSRAFFWYYLNLWFLVGVYTDELQAFFHLVFVIDKGMFVWNFRFQSSSLRQKLCASKLKRR